MGIKYPAEPELNITVNHDAGTIRVSRVQKLPPAVFTFNGEVVAVHDVKSIEERQVPFIECPLPPRLAR